MRARCCTRLLYRQASAVSAVLLACVSTFATIRFPAPVLRVIRRECRTSLPANCGCWHASPMSVSATITLAPGCSPWRLRPALAALRLPSRTVAAGPTCGAQVTALPARPMRWRPMVHASSRSSRSVPLGRWDRVVGAKAHSQRSARCLVAVRRHTILLDDAVDLLAARPAPQSRGSAYRPLLPGLKLGSHNFKTPGLQSSSERFACLEVVVRGGAEPPTFRFFGIKDDRPDAKIIAGSHTSSVNAEPA
jgi:hypothetical protein